MENHLKWWCHLDFLAGKAAPRYNPYCYCLEEIKKERKKSWNQFFRYLHEWFLTFCIKRILKIFTYLQKEKHTVTENRYFIIILNTFVTQRQGIIKSSSNSPFACLNQRNPFVRAADQAFFLDTGQWQHFWGTCKQAGYNMLGNAVTYGSDVTYD